MDLAQKNQIIRKSCYFIETFGKASFYWSRVCCGYAKAGRLVGLDDSYADIATFIVLADSATFLLAVNRIAAFWSHSAVITYEIISCRGSVGRESAHQS